MYKDFSWIPTSLLKDRVLPKIIWEPYKNQDYAGYWLPNIITITEIEGNISSTIAHEFMHQLQYLENRQVDNIFHFGYLPYTKMSYEKQIKMYFSMNPNEYEALLFEYKISKTETNDWWLNKLLKE